MTPIPWDTSTWFLPDDVSFQGVWARPNVPEVVFSDTSVAGPATHRSGPIGTNTPVELIFWGDFWDTADGQAQVAFITDGMRRMIDSPYWSGLAQYGIEPPHFREAIVVLEPNAPDRFEHAESGAEPGRMDEVLDLIDDLIDDDRLPDPDDSRFASIVFMPPEFNRPPGALGAHSSDFDYDFPLDTDMYWAGWVSYFGPGMPADYQDPEDALTIASHELVGILTSPEQDGWMMPDGRHIPDAGLVTGQPGPRRTQMAYVNGARVSSYWSNSHNATIVPLDRDYAARIVGTVEATSRVVQSTGTFRPDPTTRMCQRNPACCLPDREYTWNVFGIDATATLSIETERYRTPVTAWFIGDHPVQNNHTETINVTVEGTELRGLDAATVTKTVRITYTQSGTGLTLSTRSSELNFDLSVRCEVRDASFRGFVTTTVIATPDITVPFEGQELELETAYADAREDCLTALIEQYKQNYRVPGGPRPGRGGPIEIDSTVLATLPAWTRTVHFQRAVRAGAVERMARTMLSPEEADELTASLIADLPVLANALRARAGGSG